MRIVKCEKIYLSQREADTLADFCEILTALERESDNSNITDLVGEIQNLLGDLWDEVEDIEE